MTIKGNINHVLTERKLYQDVVLKVGILVLESVTFFCNISHLARFSASIPTDLFK